ncbi:MAG: alpha/beta hydrolase family protein [Piscinibacter sp.]|uniref:alpha/beta hydrolase family protein n=1 Tax=Piscinibacter sp. TaxID=1903157 RepID=UPI003D14B927
MRRRDALAAIAALGLPVRAAAGAEFADETWTDPFRRRDIPVRLRWPAGEDACGLVIHSHGLGGSRSGGAVWGEAWQAGGLAVLHLQHPGSDSGVWQSGGLRGARRAASAEQYLARIADARFVLDEIERRRGTGGSWARVRPEAIGFSGHSFGARLTQALAGERPARARRAERVGEVADPRIRAFIAFSSGFNERDGLDDATLARRFGAITRPFLAMTGSDDEAMLVGDASNAARRAVYRGLPPGQKAQLVLDGADHATFGGGTGLAWAEGRSGRRGERAVALEAQHRRVIAAISVDWWRWRLLGDAAAQARLRAPADLAAADLWEQG